MNNGNKEPMMIVSVIIDPDNLECNNRCI